MIQANELRIGNLVTDEWGRSIFIVDSINSKGIDLEIQDDGNWLEIAQTWIEPNYKFEELRCIQLTEDWLLKFGFTFKDNGDDFDTYSLKSVEVWEHDDGFCHSYALGGDVLYVHQLQNLYFALTGSELVLSNVPVSSLSEQ